MGLQMAAQWFQWLVGAEGNPLGSKAAAVPVDNWFVVEVHNWVVVDKMGVDNPD